MSVFAGTSCTIHELGPLFVGFETVQKREAIERCSVPPTPPSPSDDPSSRHLLPQCGCVMSQSGQSCFPLQETANICHLLMVNPDFTTAVSLVGKEECGARLGVTSLFPLSPAVKVTAVFIPPSKGWRLSSDALYLPFRRRPLMTHQATTSYRDYPPTLRHSWSHIIFFRGEENQSLHRCTGTIFADKPSIEHSIHSLPSMAVNVGIILSLLTLPVDSSGPRALESLQTASLSITAAPPPPMRTFPQAAH
ncbi:hypothetical protein EDB92DRAFT_1957934 [Lactarius akahatsu]|uniref:Uncharacterized protein n=1 Tax=Lactarius akahatsu TaxID=416441 RepID=A0AAD4L4H6_9AGAM|nr:hypothetical protein EDB92DRAFT_1957934 [Lactarius akahatsu]